MEQNFSTLYSKKSSNKILEWNINVSGTKNKATITTIYGDKDGKKIESNQIITIGKNLGKKNETNPFEQAVKEATSKWSNKLKAKGYVKEFNVILDDCNNVTDKKKSKKCNSDINYETVRPMLAQTYEKSKKHIIYPCYVQPKLDGIRCIAYKDDNGIQLMSRQGKQFPHLDHIRKSLENIEFKGFFDGELFTRNLEFQEISGIVRKEKIKPDDLKKSKLIEYHIYDIFHEDFPDMSFHDRFNSLHQLIPQSKYLVEVETFICNTEEDMLNKYSDYTDQDYEGIMIRNCKGKYKLKYRSNDLIKLKPFQDSEFKIISFKDGVGREKGCVIWICDNGKGEEFNVKPKGTLEERSTLYKNGKKYIGKLLTVRYQELINDIPRFGVGIDIRDYE